MTATPLATLAPAEPGAPARAPQGPAAGAAGEGFFGEDGLTFEDFLDVINPLQHVPVISAFYRSATGDEISIGARVLGGALFGGALGLISAIFNAIIADATGKDIGEHALALFDDANEAPETTAVAAASLTPLPLANPRGESKPFATGPPAEPAAAGRPYALAFDPAPKNLEAEERDDDPAQIRPWPTPSLHADQDHAAMEARFGNPTGAAGWVLLVLGQALDKYDNVRQARDSYERHPIARRPVTEGVDTIA